jgi:hypothetical protein
VAFGFVGSDDDFVVKTRSKTTCINASATSVQLSLLASTFSNPIREGSTASARSQSQATGVPDDGFRIALVEVPDFTLGTSNLVCRISQ